MPALILAFYENGNVVEYVKVKEQDDEARLDMVATLRALPPKSTWRIVLQVIQISRGLEYLHGQSIIHGDLRGVSTLLRVIINTFHPSGSQTCWLTKMDAPVFAIMV